METKPLLIGIISFIAGALLVSIASITFEKDKVSSSRSETTSKQVSGENSLKNKQGDDFDEAFIKEMILHHEGAIAMAKAAQTNAKHTEIKNLAADIISAQQKEIDQMKQWQKNWGYSQTTQQHRDNAGSH